MTDSAGVSPGKNVSAEDVEPSSKAIAAEPTSETGIAPISLGFKPSASDPDRRFPSAGFVDPFAAERDDGHSPSFGSPTTVDQSSSSSRTRPVPKPFAGSHTSKQDSGGLPFIAYLRRGSLTPAMAAPALTARRGSDPTGIELSPIASARDLSSPLRSTDDDPLNRNFASLGRHKGTTEGLTGREPTREEVAVAKWRKWAIEIPESQNVSPLTHPRRSTSGLAPISPTVLSASSSSIPPASPARPQPSPSNSGDSQTYPASRPERGSSSRPGSSRLEPAGMEIYLTDTARALKDVELAVDESVLSGNTQSPSQQRRLSVKARVSENINPFVDLASRLGSRRVRPIVIELIQALGHYIDAVWTVRYPSIRCPWIITNPSSEGRMSMRSWSNDEDVWKSRAITAVQEGKPKGYVRDPQNMADVKFWEDEVKYGLLDVDQVVGIYKGVGWAFTTALKEGRYGDVVSSNVLGKDGSGGNIARLLNDLEDVIWGDAQPRPTDLSFDLPQDFDPYAVMSEDDLSTPAAAGGSLAAFFGGGRPSITQIPHIVPEDAYNNVDLPEIKNDPLVSESTRSLSGPMSEIGVDPLGLDAFKIEGKELSLEEIGQRRHREWLASRGAAAV